MVDLHRKRVEFAVDTVSAWLNEGEVGKKLGVQLPGLPVMLRTQGLLITYLTLRAKDGGHKLAHALQVWLTREAPRPTLPAGSSDADFVALCTQAERFAYLAAQWEAIEIAQALKLAGEALELTTGK